MAEYGKLVDKVIEYAPKNYKREDGSLIINFSENKEMALAYGYKEVIQNIPKYDKDKEALIMTDCDETETTLTPTYEVVQIQSLLNQDDLDDKTVLKILKKEILDARIGREGKIFDSLSLNLKDMIDYFSPTDIFRGYELPTEGDYKMAIIFDKNDLDEDDGKENTDEKNENFEVTEPNSESVIVGEKKRCLFVPYFVESGLSDIKGYPDELVAVSIKKENVGKIVEVKNTNTSLDGLKFSIKETIAQGNLLTSALPLNTELIGIVCKTKEAYDSLKSCTGVNSVIGKLIDRTSPVATVVYNGLNVRTGAGSSNKSIGYVYKGYIFPILETYSSTTWIKVLYEGQEAYINGAPTYCSRGVLRIDSDGYPIVGYGVSGFPSNSTLVLPAKGIDVSSHNGTLNWANIKDKGYQFAIIRVGYGSRTKKGGILDSQFKRNVQECIKAGIPFGCYFFSYASSLEGLKAEAQFVIDTLAPYKGKIEFPIFFDQEYDSLKTKLNSNGTYITSNPGKTTLTKYINTFCETLNSDGWATGIYSNKNWQEEYIDFEDIKNLDLWFSNPETSSHKWTKSDVKIWQYTWKLNIDGEIGAFNGNYCYIDYPQIIKASNKNGF